MGTICGPPGRGPVSTVGSPENEKSVGNEQNRIFYARARSSFGEGPEPQAKIVAFR
jgi:hypothetical protein